MGPDLGRRRGWRADEDGDRAGARLADGPTLSLARIKEAMNRASATISASSSTSSATSSASSAAARISRKASQAFLAKRKPNFKGK
jgi:2-(1,2-epoxy-1,2-dihydrophenyl)acetyl-CoA isomerase